MELYKLQQEKAEFEQRLYAVIKGEIRKFMTEGGLHPTEVNVNIVDLNVFGKEPESAIVGVEVRFGL